MTLTDMVTRDLAGEASDLEVSAVEMEAEGHRLLFEAKNARLEAATLRQRRINRIRAKMEPKVGDIVLVSHPCPDSPNGVARYPYFGRIVAEAHSGKWAVIPMRDAAAHARCAEKEQYRGRKNPYEKWEFKDWCRGRMYL
jgi:hypothetical protein